MNGYDGNAISESEQYGMEDEVEDMSHTVDYTKGKLHNHDIAIHIQYEKNGEVIEHTCIANANDALKNAIAIAEEIVHRWNAFDQQPPAGDYPKRTIENTEVCSCGNIFVEDDDYDTLGSESGVCCPDCGNEKFQTVKDRLDSVESINADLLKVQKILQTKSEIHRPEPLVKPTWVCLKEADYTELEIILVAAIEKAKKDVK